MTPSQVPWNTGDRGCQLLPVLCGWCYHFSEPLIPLHILPLFPLCDCKLPNHFSFSSHFCCLNTALMDTCRHTSLPTSLMVSLGQISRHGNPKVKGVNSWGMATCWVPRGCLPWICIHASRGGAWLSLPAVVPTGLAVAAERPHISRVRRHGGRNCNIVTYTESLEVHLTSTSNGPLFQGTGNQDPFLIWWQSMSRCALSTSTAILCRTVAIWLERDPALRWWSFWCLSRA